MKSRPPPGRGAVVPAEKKRPLKPIVITRDKLQKEVFGMGYKNLPILSIEEFYEQGSAVQQSSICVLVVKVEHS